MNNLEKNSKIEIRTDGRKSYDIILKDSFDDFLKQMEFLEIEHKKICIVTESNVAPFYLKQMYDLISSKAAKTITFSFEAGEKPFAFSCLPYTASEIENALHHEELPPARRTVLCVYGAVRGVGGIDSWGTDVEEEYRISAEDNIDYSFTIC